MRYSRQNKILELISSNEIETQDKLAAMLKEEGFEVTQATISREDVYKRQVSYCFFAVNPAPDPLHLHQNT